MAEADAMAVDRLIKSSEYSFVPNLVEVTGLILSRIKQRPRRNDKLTVFKQNLGLAMLNAMHRSSSNHRLLILFGPMITACDRKPFIPRNLPLLYLCSQFGFSLSPEPLCFFAPGPFL